MYSVVVMVALTSGMETPDLGGRRGGHQQSSCGSASSCGTVSSCGIASSCGTVSQIATCSTSCGSTYASCGSSGHGRRGCQQQIYYYSPTCSTVPAAAPKADKMPAAGDPKKDAQPQGKDEQTSAPTTPLTTPATTVVMPETVYTQYQPVQYSGRPVFGRFRR